MKTGSRDDSTEARSQVSKQANNSAGKGEHYSPTAQRSADPILELRFKGKCYGHVS